MQAISSDELLAKLLQGLAGESFSESVAARTANAALRTLRAKVDNEVRRRVAEKKGKEHVAKYSVPKKLDEVIFLNASEAELAELQNSVTGIGRLLASRLALRRRRGQRGTIDLRKTLRKSLSTGGFRSTWSVRSPAFPGLSW